MRSTLGTAVAASAMLLSATAAAEVITDGESLRQRCAAFQLITPTAGLGCRGYIGALVDVLTDGNGVNGIRACPPADEKRETTIKVVKAWLEQNPAALPEKASVAVARALAEEYPCPDP